MNNRFGLIDSTSKVVIPIEYQYGFNLLEDFYWTEKNNSWIIIQKNGTEIIPENNYNIKPSRFKEGLSRVIRNGKYGFVNGAGKEIISCIYDTCRYHFEEGFIAMRLGGKWGYLNKQGEVVVDFKYNYADDFQEGRALVAEKTKGYGFVDTTGKEIISLQY